MEEYDYERAEVGVEPIFVDIKEELDDDDVGENEEQISAYKITEVKEEPLYENVTIREELNCEDINAPQVSASSQICKNLESSMEALLASACQESLHSLFSIATSTAPDLPPIEVYRKEPIASNSKSYKCSECSYVAQSQFHFETHVKYHKGKCFMCNECDYISNLKWQLKRHLRTHTGEKPYKCSDCDYKTALSATLKAHIRQHTGEKPYKCGECEYRTKRKSLLEDHIRRHKGEKPFKCNYCKFGCAARAHLVEHTRIHTGEKPYSCNQCSYTARQKSSLKRHLTKHTTDKPFRCDQCDYSAGQKVHLKNHLLKHTGENLPAPKKTSCQDGKKGMENSNLDIFQDRQGSDDVIM